MPDCSKRGVVRRCELPPPTLQWKRARLSIQCIDEERLRSGVTEPSLDGLSDQPVRNFCRLLDLDLTGAVSGESLQAGAVLDDAQEFFRQNGVNVRLDFLRGHVTTAYLVIAQRSEERRVGKECVRPC